LERKYQFINITEDKRPQSLGRDYRAEAEGDGYDCDNTKNRPICRAQDGGSWGAVLVKRKTTSQNGRQIVDFV